MVAHKFCPHSFRAKSSGFAKILHKFFSLGLLSPQLLALARGGPKFIQPTLASSNLLFKKHFFKNIYFKIFISKLLISKKIISKNFISKNFIYKKELFKNNPLTA
jgi:hypothetical protein